LAAVASGSVSAGVVYATDAATSKGVRLAFTVANGPPITYSVAALAGSKRSAEAQAFVKFLESNEAKTVFQKRGFRILGAP
jgi:molybdate transport system substrate-binding protein